MTSKMPAWVETGAFLLAFNAGIINGVGLVGWQHQSVSHMSGNSTEIGLAVVQGNFSQVLHLVIVLLSFLCGAVLSGVIIQDTALRLGRRYSFALFCESGFLLISMLLLNSGIGQGDYWASAACGLQNAMVTTYSGAILRTTHVTGTFTDLGMTLGHMLRGIRVDRRRIVLYVLLISGFISGGVVGAYLFLRIQYSAFCVPVALTAALSVLYWAYRYHLQHEHGHQNKS
ncbi:MAG: YoaK family protein [Stenotrophobium sp.]